MGARGEAESDGADEKEIAGQELEVSRDGLRDVGVIVGTESGLPKEGGSEESGEDVN